MKSLALAVLIFPSMSVIRGYFQGLNQVKAYAMSQLLEQIVRVIWMLAATFAIMKLGSHNWQNAVTQSTLAAFIGMLGSYAVLFYYLQKSSSNLFNKFFFTEFLVYYIQYPIDEQTTFSSRILFSKL